MRPAGRFVAAVLTELAERTRVGINVLELDRIAHAMIREQRATSCYIDYHPSFGAMPFGKVLCVSVNDAVLHGLPHDRRLRDGDLVSLDFAAAVDGWVADSAITIPVGPPDVPNHGVAGRGLALRPGLVIAIEPWFLARSPKIIIDRDGWTIRSVDRSRGVHVEHTVVITADGPLVLTARDAVAASAPVRAASGRHDPVGRGLGDDRARARRPGVVDGGDRP